MVADWSQAPADVLWNIIKRLPSADYIRFGGVCVPWRSTLAEKLCGPAPELPWLVLPGDGAGGNEEIVRFHSLTEKKDYRMSLPAMRCIGSSEGFLIYIDEDAELHMVDPISGARVDLPSITTFPDILDVSRDSQGRITDYLFNETQGRYPPVVSDTDYIRTGYFKKVIVSPGSTPENYTVVAIHSMSCGKLAFARAGDKAWNLIQIPKCQGFTDAIFHNQLLYALEHRTMVLTINLNHPSRPVVSLGGPVNDGVDSRRYVIMLSGELFQVWRFVKTSFPQADEYITFEVLVHKMDSTSHKWVEAKSIGDHALFLGHGRSVSFSTWDFPQLKPNCIYFTDDSLECYFDLVPPYTFDMGGIRHRRWKHEALLSTRFLLEMASTHLVYS